MADQKQGFLKSQLGVLQIPIVTTAILWTAFILDWILPGEAAQSFGLMPRTFSGAWGIVGMPFVHAGWAHLIANTVPLLVLTTLLAITGKGWKVMAGIVVLNGVLLWLFGRGGRVHVGASGLVYGLALYIIFRGFVERKLVLILVSIGVALLYGTVLLWGVIPTRSAVSWEGHLFGGVAGAVLALQLRKKPAGDRAGGAGAQ